MSLQAKIRGFGSYSPTVLEKMRADLGLSLPTAVLSRCAAYYRTREKRDPLVDELRMLDRFAAVCRPSVGIAELLTNDACVARTYADAIAKRRALRPDAAAPITLDEAFALANQALMRVGKTPTLKGLDMSLQPIATHVDRARALREATSSTYLTLSGSHTAPITAGDLLVLLRPMETVVGRGLDPVSDFLGKRDVRARIKHSLTVAEGGLLAILLACGRGAQIDLTRLSVTGEELPCSMLVDAYEGSSVVLLARREYEGFAQAAQAHAIRLQAFASLNDSARLAFFRSHDLPAFAFETAFLRSFIPFRSLSVALDDEWDTAFAPISHRTVRADHSAYIQTDRSCGSETLALGGLLHASATSSAKNVCYRNAIDTALAPILALAASGADYSTARLAVSMTRSADSSDKTATQVISTILGLYRVQTELGIPMAASRILYEKERIDTSLSVTAIAPEKPALPSVFATANHGLYCLAPALDGDQQIDFAALREMLTYLTTLANEGVIKGVRLICRESLTSVLQEMQTDTLTCRITDNAWACEGEIPLAILIEADGEIRAKRVGTVVVREGSRAPVVTPDLPSCRCLLPVNRSSVTLISAHGDTDAQTLADELKRRGTEVFLHAPVDAPVDIARSILSCATLILCGSIMLPENELLNFAARTHTEAGGLVLLLGGADHGIFSNAIALADGLSEKNLEKICKK